MPVTEARRTEGRADRLLASAERGGNERWAWLLLLLGWVLARNLLEGILEQPHQLGFDWREEFSFPMVFLHFPLFYLGLFAWIGLWLHVLTQRPLIAILRALSLGFAVILVAPLVDALVSRGKGYDLKYTLGFGSYLWRFWDPGAPLDEVSPGQRVEIVLAVLLAGAYVWFARRRQILAALAGAAGVYVIAAFLGAWPSLFARITIVGETSAQDAYHRVYQLGGLIPNESRRLALIMALPFVAALLLLLRRGGGEAWRAVVRRLGWTRLLHYTGLVLAGAYLGYLVYREYLPVAYTNPIDFTATAVLWFAMVLAYVAAALWNDLYDLEADAINAPDRPLAAGTLEPAQARRYAWMSAGAAIYFSLCVSYAAALLIAACLFLAWLYSAPPVRLKRWPVASTGSLALLSVISAMAGFSMWAQETSPLVFPRRVGMVLLASITLGFTAKDLKDARGDRATGVITLATLLPPDRARGITAALVMLAYLIAIPLLRMGPLFAIAAAAFGAVSAFLTLRLRRPDGPLLLVFAGFAVLTLGFLGRNPRILRDQVPEPLLSAHAGILRLEDTARIHRLGLREEPPPPSRAGPSEDAFDRVLAQGGPFAERIRWAHVQLDATPGSPARGSSAHEQTGGPALEQARALVREHPLVPAYREFLCSSLNAAGEADEAVEVCSAALALGLRPGDFLCNRAALRLASADPTPETRQDLTGAYLYGRRETVLLGDYLLRSSDMPGAILAYDSATRSRPASAEAWAGLGQALHAAHRLEEARAALERAQSLDPTDPWIRNNLGVVLRDLGRPDEAKQAFEHAHALAPGLFEPVFNLALLAERLGRMDEAREWLIRARQMRPGFPPVEAAWTRVSSGPMNSTGVGGKEIG